MPHVVTLVPGDGTGPELTEATRRVLEATGVEFTWDVRQAGVDVMEAAGTPLPEETLASIKRNGVALKGPITTPIGTGFRSVNVALRHELGLYACVRPCKSYPGVRSRYEGVDVVVVRENTEDLYAGIEFESDTDDAHAVSEDEPAFVDFDRRPAIAKLDELPGVSRSKELLAFIPFVKIIGRKQPDILLVLPAQHQVPPANLAREKRHALSGRIAALQGA